MKIKTLDHSVMISFMIDSELLTITVCPGICFNKFVDAYFELLHGINQSGKLLTNK